MSAIDDLIRKDRESPKRIACLGDSLTDVWIHGHLGTCQENCPRFIEDERIETPGGVVNACLQLDHWNSPCAHFNQHRSIEPIKTRFLVDGKIIFRHDDDEMDVENVLKDARRTQIEKMFSGNPDAVLISDYDKGFLTDESIRQVIDECNRRGIVVVADAKRHPNTYAESVVKCNRDYADKFATGLLGKTRIITRGGDSPIVWDDDVTELAPRRKVECVSHVGAGDCFAAHLTLALAHGLSLADAAEIAHSAGRVYVQYPHSRPPWPHEIRKDLDPVGGKVLSVLDLAALRKSVVAGRIVFANGCFDLFGPHHLHYLNESKKMGDVLVVGVNDDESVHHLKGSGRPIIPQEQRAMLLAGLECVDWVFVFGGPWPAELQALKPDIRACGAIDNRNTAGDQFCGEVRLIPLMEGWSTTSTVTKIRNQ